MSDRPSHSQTASREPAEFRLEVERLLALIRPSVQEDGGDIELVSTDPEGLVRIRFLGACVGCPSSNQTLHHGIARTLRTKLGAHIRVESVA
jgi:Fe-S cluster biogenesis protein NfuA